MASSSNQSTAGDASRHDHDHELPKRPSQYPLIVRPVPVWVVNQHEKELRQQPRQTPNAMPSFLQGRTMSTSSGQSQEKKPGHNSDSSPLQQKKLRQKSDLGPILPELPQPVSIHSDMSRSLAPQLHAPTRPRTPTEKSRWSSFITATTRSEVRDSMGYIDEKVLESQGDFTGSWIGDNQETSLSKGRKARKRRHPNEPYALSSARYFVSEESRKIWQPRLTFILLNNPYVPLTLRLIIFILSVFALALACSVFIHSLNAYPTPITQQPSTIMAVVVQTTALVYLVYITYDEYSGKPLGLREPKAKMRLIMLDLLFIIFSSANLSLTFNTLYDVTWTCHVDNDPAIRQFSVPYNFGICSRQRGLASLLFMILVMWIATFTISIFRLVERVSQN